MIVVLILTLAWTVAAVVMSCKAHPMMDDDRQGDE